MNCLYDEQTGTYTLEMTRSEAVDLTVLLGLRGVRHIVESGMYQLGDLYGRLRWLVDNHPPTDDCENCEYRIVYAEGQWRHLRDAKNRCAGSEKTAWPKGLKK